MTTRKKIVDYLQSREPDMFELTERLVTTQSYSFNKPGNDRMTEIIAEQFKHTSMACEFAPQEKLGNHLLVCTPAAATSPKRILLTGHTDTVFPEDTAFTDFTRADGLCKGPGVIDMKGGLVAGIFALKALEAAGALKDMPVVFVFNCDEEIGSPTSGPIIRRQARNALFAFVLECGGLQGEIVTGRKGNMAIALETFGKAGHAASAVKDKASAILELAHKIVAFEALNDPDRKISVNVGKIEGGIGRNTVPDRALATIDVRYERPQHRRELEEKFSRIAETANVKGASARLRISGGRPPMPQSDGNRRLYRSLNPKPQNWESRRKRNFVSACPTPTSSQTKARRSWTAWDPSAPTTTPKTNTWSKKASWKGPCCSQPP